MNRRGFTLVELIVTMGVVAILGTALAKLILSTSTFVARQEAELDARRTARTAHNLIANDLRLITSGGVFAATGTDIQLNVPYAWGVLCNEAGSATIASLMPVDSALFATAVPGVIFWQLANGSYQAGPQWPSVGPSGNLGACTADSVRVVPGGQLVQIGATGMAPPGTIFFLARSIRYRFQSSSLLPGRTGLFRTADGLPEEEVIAPFASDAGFRFLMGTQLTAQATPPTDLDSLQGLEVLLFAESESTPRGAPGPTRFEFDVRVKFANRES